MVTAAGISATIPRGLLPVIEGILGTPSTRPSLSKAELSRLFIAAYGGSRDRFPQFLGLFVQYGLSRFVASEAGPYTRKAAEAEKQRGRELEVHRQYLAACASVLGLGLRLQVATDPLDPLRVEVFVEEISDARRAERDRLHHILETDYPDELKKLLGAYERYTSGGPDAYREAIDSCRSAYEFFFRRLTGGISEPKWNTRLDVAIAGKTLNTFIRNAYSYLSGGGTHSPHDRERAETLLAIRTTEDVMIAALMSLNKW